MAKKAIDYTDFHEGTTPKKQAEDHRWWLLEEDAIPDAIHGVLTFLRERQSFLTSQRQVSARLYGNQAPFNSFGVSGGGRSSIANSPAARSRIRYNIIQSVVDTVVAKLAKNKPRPMALTSGGNYKLRRRAQKLSKFCDGVFSQNNVDRLSPLIMRDACVFGTGIVHVYEEQGRIKLERVVPDEIWVDELEAFNGAPRQMHRVKTLDRDTLMELFPDKKEIILNATSTSKEALGSAAHQSVADQITVVESWHLPSAPDAKDGAHIISISEDTLAVDSYEHDVFPFAFLRWSPRIYGFWGQGLAEQVESIQLETNKLLWVIQRSMQLAGSFRIAVKNDSKIPSSHLNDELGSIIYYNSTPPEYLVPPIVQPEIYQHLQTLRTAAYEQAGVSQLSASAKKPEGLDSGKALREYNDIESDRFMTVGQGYEAFHLDLAKLAIMVAKDIYERNGSFSVTVPGRKFIETIDWKEVSLEEDEYVLQLFPVSNLPQTPAGRLQTVTELIQGGFISPRAGSRLLNFPDLEQIQTLQDATEERIHVLLEKIVDEGDYEGPDSYMDLGLAKELALEYINLYAAQELEDSKLDKLRAFFKQADELEKLGQQAMQAANQPMQPQAVPQPPPQSQLIPNVPGASSLTAAA